MKDNIRYFSEITFKARLKDGRVKEHSFISLEIGEAVVQKEAELVYGKMLFRVDSFWSRTLKN